MSTPPVVATVLRIIGGATVVGLTLAGGLAVATELASTTGEQRFTVDGTAISAVTAVTGVGNVRVEEAATGGDIEVEARLRGSWRLPRLEQEVADGRLVLDGSCPNGVFAECAVDLVLRVPSGTDATVRTSVGNVTAVGELDRLEVETSTGNVTGRQLDVDRLRATSSVGDVTLALESPAGQVDVTSSVGSVRIVVPDDGTAYDVDVTTDVGEQRVTVPRSSGSPYAIRVSSSVGDVRVVQQGDVQPGG